MSAVFDLDETRPQYLTRHPRVAETHFASVFPFESAGVSATGDAHGLFREWAEEWKSATGYESLVSERIRHPAFRRIVRLGRMAVPLILEEMRERPDHWFPALLLITGQNAVPPDFNGTVDEAAALWQRWGEEQHAAEGDTGFIP